MADASPSPKVFISHASEDKKRFVLDFAKRLRDNGVDAWVDQWELQPGDSLVDRIFEEGIKDASAIVIVVSAISVTKAWVREELNAAVVKKIASKCRVIPVVLDRCEVPEALKSTLWISVPNPTQYDDEFKKILNALFGLSDKPPLGPPPAHSGMKLLFNIPAITKSDLMVLQTLCEESERANNDMVVDLTCLDRVVQTGLSDEELSDCLQVLEDEHYVELIKVMGPTYRNTGICGVHIYASTFDNYATARWPEYGGVLTRLVSGLVNESWQSSDDVKTLRAPERLTDHLVSMLESSGDVKVSHHQGGYHIWDISPRLKRKLARS